MSKSGQERQGTALVTGANRGLGFETCRQLARQGLHVVLTSRDETKGRQAAERLRAEGLEVRHERLDVTRDDDVERVCRTLTSGEGLDVLINNAGILAEDHQTGAFETEIETLRTTMETNVYGVFRLCQAVIPHMRERGYGRVVNVSSSMGQLATMGASSPGYRISKAALNAVTRIFAAEAEGSNVLVNSVSPGWVRTDMGGPSAPLSVEEGVETIVWLAALEDGGPNGKFFRSKREIVW